MELYVKDRTSNPISEDMCFFCVMYQCDVHKYKKLLHFSPYFITFLVADIAARNVTKVRNVTFYYIFHFYNISCRNNALITLCGFPHNVFSDLDEKQTI